MFLRLLWCRRNMWTTLNLSLFLYEWCWPNNQYSLWRVFEKISWKSALFIDFESQTWNIKHWLHRVTITTEDMPEQEMCVAKVG